MSQTLQTRTVVEAVHLDLRTKILRGEVLPGSAINELAVSAEFGVARPSAKAAIERLVAEGLLVRLHRRTGPTVPSFAREDIVDIYATRTAVEMHAHSLLVDSDADLQPALVFNAALRRAAAAADAVAVIENDVLFHRALVAAAGSVRTARMHDLLLGEAQLCMAQVQSHQLLSASEIADEHDAILRAITEKDHDGAARETSDHLRHAQLKLLTLLAESAD